MVANALFQPTTLLRLVLLYLLQRDDDDDSENNDDQTVTKALVSVLSSTLRLPRFTNIALGVFGSHGDCVFEIGGENERGGVRVERVRRVDV